MKRISSSQSRSRIKYRPVLTEEQIKYILLLSKTDYLNEGAEIALSIISSLSPFSAKIDAIAIQPSYTPAKPNVDTVLESLGETAITPPPEIPATFPSKEAYWEYCYEKWLEDSMICTMAELVACDEHRYLNDLMSTKEIKRFEQRGSI